MPGSSVLAVAVVAAHLECVFWLFFGVRVRGTHPPLPTTVLEEPLVPPAYLPACLLDPKPNIPTSSAAQVCTPLIDSIVQLYNAISY